MAEELATATYLVLEPFESALKSLRWVLEEGNLEVAGELDVSSRIRQTLRIGTPPAGSSL